MGCVYTCKEKESPISHRPAYERFAGLWSNDGTKNKKPRKQTPKQSGPSGPSLWVLRGVPPLLNGHHHLRDTVGPEGMEGQRLFQTIETKTNGRESPPVGRGQWEWGGTDDEREGDRDRERDGRDLLFTFEGGIRQERPLARWHTNTNDSRRRYNTNYWNNRKKNPSPLRHNKTK